jgi:hypothetical protein
MAHNPSPTSRSRLVKCSAGVDWEAVTGLDQSGTLIEF